MLIKFPCKISESETANILIREESIASIGPYGKQNTLIFIRGIKAPYVALVSFSVVEKFFNDLGIKVEDLHNERK